LDINTDAQQEENNDNVPYLSVVENATLPSRFSRRRYAQAKTKRGLTVEALRLLSRLGISVSRLHRPVTELSVGRQQRMGTVEEGAYADLILVDGNPLENLDLVADAENNFVVRRDHEGREGLPERAAKTMLFRVALDNESASIGTICHKTPAKRLLWRPKIWRSEE
jgi:hypothetical protein